MAKNQRSKQATSQESMAKPTSDVAISEAAPGLPDALVMRQRAEARWQEIRNLFPHTLAGLSIADTDTLLHDLQVHQIELEMQNEELRQAKNMLDDSRTRYVDLYDLAPVGYCTLNEAGFISQANLTLATLLGVARKSLEGKPLSRFIMREDQDLFHQFSKRLLESIAVVSPSPSPVARPGKAAATGMPQILRPITCELRILKPDGTRFWALLAATSALGNPDHPESEGAGSDNDVVRWQLTFTDISSVKDVETALRRSEARFHALADLSSDLYWEQDHQFRFVNVSMRFEQLSGVPQENLIGKTRWEMPSLGASPAQWSQHQALLHAHQVFRDFEYSLPSATGEPLWVSVSGAPTFDDQGQFTGYQGVARDITARKLIEVQLQATNDSLLATLNASPDLVFEIDLDGRYIAYHSVRSDLLAAPAPIFLGKRVSEVLPAAAAAVVMTTLQQAHTSGYSTGNQIELPLPDHVAYFELSCARKPTLQEETPRFVVISRDITARKQSEQERLDMAERLQVLSRTLVQAQEQTRKRFSQELHDCTSPNLAALRINLDMIANASPPTRATPAFADRVQDTRALIEDTTLSIREICAELHPPALDRGGLLGTLQSYTHQFALRTGIDVHLECSHGEIRLDADLELLLFRIVQEALTNCAKHAQAATVRVVIQLDTDPMKISVTDDGVGFNANPEHAGALRAGLGLINMQETAEFAGANYTLCTAHGQGTSIVVDIARPASRSIPVPHP